MDKLIRRFELRTPGKPRWSNLVREESSVCEFFGPIGSGATRWQVGGKERFKDYPTQQKATAAFEKRCRELLEKGYVDLCSQYHRPPRREQTPLDLSWTRIEAWLCEHAPTTCEFPLAAGASEDDLHQLEKGIGIHLPKDFRASYKRHNGSNRVSLFGVFALGYWVPLFRPKQLRPLFRSVADEWGAMTGYLREGLWDERGPQERPKGPIRRQHWNPAWIPFTCDDSGDFLCIDLDPPAGGQCGQVIFWWHEWGPYTVVADSFESLICRLADKLEAGVYAFGASEEKGEELYCTLPVQRNFNALLKMFKGR